MKVRRTSSHLLCFAEVTKRSLSTHKTIEVSTTFRVRSTTKSILKTPTIPDIKTQNVKPVTPSITYTVKKQNIASVGKCFIKTVMTIEAVYTTVAFIYLHDFLYFFSKCKKKVSNS